MNLYGSRTCGCAPPAPPAPIRHNRLSRTCSPLIRADAALWPAWTDEGYWMLGPAIPLGAPESANGGDE